MAVAMIGALLLLLGSFGVFLWVNKRVIKRQQLYEQTRLSATGHGAGALDAWRLKERQASSERLRLFNE
jgi:hypothetical protein